MSTCTASINDLLDLPINLGSKQTDPVQTLTVAISSLFNLILEQQTLGYEKLKSSVALHDARLFNTV